MSNDTYLASIACQITYASQIKRATGIAADDSQSGGRHHRISNPISGQLLLTVMSLYINFLAIDDTEVSSDKRKFTGSIFAILAKALSYAYGKMEYEHNCYQLKALRAWSGFSRLHRPFRDKTGLESKILALL